MSFRRTLALALVLVASVAASAAAQNGTIAGRVMDVEGDRPVAGATVRALHSTGTAAAATMTDDDGQYRLSVPPATYTISVRRIGYGETEQRAVVVTAGGTTQADVTVSAVAIVLNPTVVTPTRAEEKAQDAPAHTEVVTAVVIEERPTLTPVDQIRSVPGVDYASTGVQGGNVVVRGFNNVFSGAMLTISDYRYATVPSLRVNTPYLVPTPNEDVGQIEVVLGPGAALYGPNAANGVMHIISKSPFESQGTTVSIGGGNRSILRGAIRHAGTSGDRFGYKISGQLLRAEDWHYTDPAETLPRDFDVERWSGELRFDIRPTTASELILSGGRAFAGSALEMTGIGTAQAKDWSYDFGQARFRWNRLFAQAFINTSNTSDTYLLRTGQNVVDKSRVLVGQVQHGLDLGDRQTFIYGVDYSKTDPRTQGTINGRNENIDEISEIGAYLQSETRLSSMFDFVAALRVDDHSELEDPVFSPRAALVWKADAGHTLRFTYNRAFNTPTTNNLFLDLIAQTIPVGPFRLNVRTLGVPQTGLQFRRNCTAVNGNTLCMKSLFTPPALGGPQQYLPTDVTAFWGVAQLVAAQAGVDISGVPRPTAAQVPTVMFARNAENQPFVVQPGDVRDIGRLEPTITSTYEVGYNGLVGARFRIAADVYFEKKTDFVGPLIVETPTTHFAGTQLAGYLIANGIAPAQAAVAATAIARVPVGVVTPDNDLTQNPELILTYRNFGNLDRWGGDLAFDVLMTDRVSLTGSYSFVNKNFFSRAEVGGVSDVALNAPKNKATLGVAYREHPTGVTVDLRGRWSESFPMNSGVFIGRVDTYTLLDASVAYRFPFAQNTILSLNVQNVFDDRHREFVGAPELGRLLLTQLQVTF
ncbi:MAG: TonB-dependent receptor domain-containing protein [Gemmatimonadaceae bacterium]